MGYGICLGLGFGFGFRVGRVLRVHSGRFQM